MQKTITAQNVSGGVVEAAFSTLIEGVRATPEPAPESLPYLCPGFVDVQVNSFAGVDYNSGDTRHEEIARSIHVLYATGITRFYPTVITGGPEDMRGALENLARAKESLPDGGAMDGFHVEGPHISPEDGPRGAHPRRCAVPDEA